jgi:dimethylamine monooxygenase subunit A
VSPECLGSYAPDAALYRPQSWPGWVDELDLSLSDTHVRMGTRALPAAEWLVRDDLAESEIALRRRLLAEQRERVLVRTEWVDAAAAEAGRLVDDWLGTHGLPPADPAESDPLARAATAIQEDLCLMVRHDGAWHLEAACLCFPSMWSLAEKIGRPAAQVHAPVAHYAEELSARVDTFFDRLAPDRLVRRRNLSLWPCCLLWVPTSTLAPVLWDRAGPGPRLWLRSERQTLRRLPGSGAILFTIRVQMAHLSVLALRPRRAGELAAWLRGPGGESRREQLGPLLDADLSWLDGVGAGGSG